MMTLKEYIQEHYDGNLSKFTRAYGEAKGKRFYRTQIQRCRDGGAVIDHNMDIWEKMPALREK